MKTAHRPVLLIVLAISLSTIGDGELESLSAQESAIPEVVRLRHFDREQLNNPAPIFGPA